MNFTRYGACTKQLACKKLSFCSSLKALSTDTSFVKIGVCCQKLLAIEFNFHYWLSSHCVYFHLQPLLANGLFLEVCTCLSVISQLTVSVLPVCGEVSGTSAPLFSLLLRTLAPWVAVVNVQL